MVEMQQESRSNEKHTLVRDLLKELAPYREPSHMRSAFELVVTAALFGVFWAAAWWSFSISYWLTLVISIPAAAFLVRLFLIKHDCGHGAFFKRRSVNNWVGRVLGVFTLTPYNDWRDSHAKHHATSGNLDTRGYGDIDVLTIAEYRKMSSLGRFGYHLYRHPLILFGIGPAYQFLIRNRLPHGLKNAKSGYWISVMGTNLGIALVIGMMIYFLGAGPVLLVHLPIAVLASSIGVWLFYVQHQFEDTYWTNDTEWEMQDAALQGSSHFDLPGVLKWLTANIGVHHVHHLSSRIPYYRLPQVLRAFPELVDIRRITLKQSLSCLRLRLWDENQNKLVSFSDARAVTVK
jgi:omega-6 fatty acid desaturase (delta-12 desaturase)